MNNDMTGKLGNYFDAQKNGCADNLTTQEQMSQPLFLSDEEAFNKIVGVNTVSKSVKEATQEFIENPEIIESYISLCDGFVENGSCLREAIDKTDRVFNALKDKNIYE